MNKRLLLVCVLLILAVASGVAYDRHRANQRQELAARIAAEQKEKANKRPPLPVWGSLIASGENVEVRGSAMCGYCTWRVGEPPDNLVLQTPTEPGIVFVLPNETRTEIEKLTGPCAGGDYYVTARGSMSQYNGRNYLLAKSFTAVKTK